MVVNIMNLAIGEVIDTDERAFLKIEEASEEVTETSFAMIPGELFFPDNEDEIAYIIEE